MTNIELILIGFGVGLVMTIVVLIWQSASKREVVRADKQEIERLRRMINDKMDIEADGLRQLKAQVEELKQKNENLRITNSALSQKPGRAEVERLQIYQKAVDRLTINSPGFGPAWQSALKESEEEFARIYNGTEAFWKKVLPGRTNAKLIEKQDVVDEQ